MKTARYLVITAIVLVASVMAWSMASAQQASSTAEPSSTEVATAQATPQPMPAQAKPFLGVSLQDSANGVTIAEVVDGSGAAAAGLQVGDVITAVNGTTVSTAAEVAKLVASMNVGDTVTIAYTRGTDKLTATATLGTVPANLPSTVPNPIQRPPRQNGNNGNGNNGNNGNGAPNGNNPMGMFPYFFGTGHLGVTFVTIDSQVMQQYNLTVSDGALITAVEANSPATDAGLQVNDIITAVEGDKLDQKRTLFYRLLPYQPGDAVTLTISRDGQSMDINVTLGQQQQMADGMPFGFQFNGPNGNGGPNGGFRFFGFPFGNRNGAAPQAQPTPEATPNM